MWKLSRLAILVCTLGVLSITIVVSQAAESSKFRYHYVSLDAAVPAGYYPYFDRPTIADSGRVYGTVYGVDPGTYEYALALYHQGKMTILGPGYVNDANDREVLAGAVPRDPAQFTSQAALFIGKRAKLIPPLPNEWSSFATLLTNNGLAVVAWYTENYGALSYYLLNRERITPLTFAPTDVNERAIMSGTSRADPNRAFRFYLASGTTVLLAPRPTELYSWGQGINSRGDVLGYSFNTGAAGTLQAIGVWRGSNFQTYFVEGIPEAPSRSDHLVWNERGLIVSTRSLGPLSDLSSYLISRPGVRFKIADLVVDGSLPVWTDISDINDRGDIVGNGSPSRFTYDTGFLLQRIADDDRSTDSIASKLAAGVRPAQPLPPTVARAVARVHAMMDRGGRSRE